MTRATSLAAYRSLALPEAQAKVLLAVRLHGPCTGAELDRACGAEARGHWHKRLPELRDLGHIHEAGRRACKVTGRRAIVWQADSRPADTVEALSADGEGVPSTGRAGRQPRRVVPSGREASGRYCMHVDDHGRPYCNAVGDKCPDCGRVCVDVTDEGKPYGVVRTMVRA